jgi:hypothetical protein
MCRRSSRAGREAAVIVKVRAGTLMKRNVPSGAVPCVHEPWQPLPGCPERLTVAFAAGTRVEPTSS